MKKKLIAFYVISMLVVSLLAFYSGWALKASAPAPAEKVELNAPILPSTIITPELAKSENKVVSRGSNERNAKKFIVSAYTLREEECGRPKDYPNFGRTASGVQVTPWQTIAASRSIPFGTKVYIPYFKSAPNGGVFIVEDRGGAVDENEIDIYMTDLKSALTFGRRELDVYVLKGE